VENFENHEILWGGPELQSVGFYRGAYIKEISILFLRLEAITNNKAKRIGA